MHPKFCDLDPHTRAPRARTPDSHADGLVRMQAPAVAAAATPPRARLSLSKAIDADKADAAAIALAARPPKARLSLSKVIDADQADTVAEDAVLRIQATFRGQNHRTVPITVWAARARAEEEKLAKHSKDKYRLSKKVATSLAKLLCYLLLGVLIYGAIEPTFGQASPATTTVIDSIYFSVATMSTVGYGDLSPTSPGSRLFTLFMIYGGIIFVFSDITSVFGLMTAPITLAGRRQMERLFPQVGVDLTGDGTFDYYKPRPPLIYYVHRVLGLEARCHAAACIGRSRVRPSRCAVEELAPLAAAHDGRPARRVRPLCARRARMDVLRRLLYARRRPRGRLGESAQ